MDRYSLLNPNEEESKKKFNGYKKYIKETAEKIAEKKLNQHQLERDIEEMIHFETELAKIATNETVYKNFYKTNVKTPLMQLEDLTPKASVPR